jgi:hypothetical protein
MENENAGKDLSSKKMKTKMNRMLLEEMAKKDWEGFWNELK